VQKKSERFRVERVGEERDGRDGKAKSVMERAVESKEDMDDLVDTTGSPRAAKTGRYGVESSDKYRTRELH
jgi:hypothetical protein